MASLTPDALQQQVQLMRPETLEEALEHARVIEEILSESQNCSHPQVRQAHLQSPLPEVHCGKPHCPGLPRTTADNGTQVCWRCGTFATTETATCHHKSHGHSSISSGLDTLAYMHYPPPPTTG
ncbi:hypothetical protein AAFF_G00003030 [Aldrovandia affinis]|uniref:Uncharacterized protein n=1 Tax=Aldrovandia affinis TaxID=143900 RepID=A0AAD7TD71_9TELE|nr:hypothetical protein AAFF_G00003030 [Aldrovandia affinis]